MTTKKPKSLFSSGVYAGVIDDVTGLVDDAPKRIRSQKALLAFSIYVGLRDDGTGQERDRSDIKLYRSEVDGALEWRAESWRGDPVETLPRPNSLEGAKLDAVAVYGRGCGPWYARKLVVKKNAPQLYVAGRSPQQTTTSAKGENEALLDELFCRRSRCNTAANACSLD